MKCKCFLKALAMIGITAGMMAPAAVYADEAYEEKSVTAYVFDMDTTDTAELVFTKELPEIPYIGISDYLSHICKDKITEEKAEDGSFVITANGKTMKVDAKEDKVSFDQYIQFIGLEFVVGEMLDSSSINTEIRKEISSSVEGEKPLSLDMKAYGIDILEVDGKAYLPLPTVRDMFGFSCNSAQYIDGKLYYTHTTDLLGEGCYYNTTSVYDKLQRDSAEAEYIYQELCFNMDHFYGAPSNGAIAESIREKGFDKTLDSSEELKSIKTLLKSEDMVDYAKGMFFLTPYMYDGGHTVFSADVTGVVDRCPESALAREYGKWMGELDESDPSYPKVINVFTVLRSGIAKIHQISAVKSTAFSNMQQIKIWKNGDSVQAALYFDSDTAYFAFDSFEMDTALFFKEAVDLAAADQNISNFVVDLSTNGGGVTTVGTYMLALMKNRNKDSNTIELYISNTTSGAKGKSVEEIDLNLDGVFDEKDKATGYDLNFAVLESERSFSTGNYVPVMAKELGIAVIGETSGGGGCMMLPAYAGNDIFFMMSGPIKFFSEQEVDFDLGATPDTTLVKENGGAKDYSDFFNTPVVSAAISKYYAIDDQPHGKWHKDSKGWWFGDDFGWYAKNQWQKIDGKWYFFDKEGYMEANAYRQGYYLKANGAWDGKTKVTGWKQDSKGWWYSLGGKNYLKNGWKKIDGNWYYFKATGYIAINEFVQGWWLNKAGAWKDPVQCSWHKSGSKWWYGTKDGWYAKSKSYTIDGKKYTFDKKGYTK